MIFDVRKLETSKSFSSLFVYSAKDSCYHLMNSIEARITLKQQLLRARISDYLSRRRRNI